MWDYDDNQKGVVVLFDESSKRVKRIVCSNTSAKGLCVTSIAMSTGDAQLYER
jgi:hypothetical protein